MRIIVLCSALVLSTGALFAGGRTLWQEGGVQLCGPSAEGDPLATSDGAGGAIVMWDDGRHDFPHDIYAQRVSAAGEVLWAGDGVPVYDSTTGGAAGVIDDGEHGAIAVWNGAFAGPSLAVQRVGADGSLLWGSHGVGLRPHTGFDLYFLPALVRDGHGGAIVVFSTYALDLVLDTLIACRVDSSGTKLWETVVRIDTLGVDPPCLCEDGMGGVIIAWQEYEAGIRHVRVQRVDSAGATNWGTEGVRACTLSTTQAARACLAVGQSSFVVGWFGGAGTWQHRAQMFNLSGNRQWGLAGTPVSGGFSSGSGSVGLPARSAGQTVWIWTQNRTGTDDLFAQKLDSSGARCWDTTGVWVGTTDTADGYPFTATVDGRGGAITAWPLFHTDRNSDEYAQHVDSVGNLCWSDTGLAVCRDTDDQRRTPAVVSDGDGGAIVVWLELRWGVGSAICAQRVVDGAWIEETPNAEVRTANTSPTVVRGVLELQVGSRQQQVDRGELIDASGRSVLGLHTGPNDVRHLSPGVYFVHIVQGQAQAQAIQKIVITR
jgi:hypothetical protein